MPIVARFRLAGSLARELRQSGAQVARGLDEQMLGVTEPVERGFERRQGIRALGQTQIGGGVGESLTCRL